jgi:hypothetical protein
MTGFFFTTVSGTDVQSNIPVQCPTLGEAKTEALRVLVRMVGERLPDDPCEMLSVEIFDDAEKPLTELRLMYQEIDK